MNGAPSKEEVIEKITSAKASRKKVKTMRNSKTSPVSIDCTISTIGPRVSDFLSAVCMNRSHASQQVTPMRSLCTTRSGSPAASVSAMFPRMRKGSAAKGSVHDARSAECR